MLTESKQIESQSNIRWPFLAHSFVAASFSLFDSGFYHKMGKKEWMRFIQLRVQGVDVHTHSLPANSVDGKTKVCSAELVSSCFVCLVGNATRWKEHMKGCVPAVSSTLTAPLPPTQPPANSQPPIPHTQSPTTSPPSSHHQVVEEEVENDLDAEARPKKQQKISHFLDQPISAAQKEGMTKSLALAAVQNGWSANSLQTKHFQAFCTLLRPAFSPPSPFLLQKAVESLFEECQQKLAKKLKQAKVVFLSLDEWENHQRSPMLAFTVIKATGESAQSALWKFELMTDRPTSEFLASEIQAVVQVCFFLPTSF